MDSDNAPKARERGYGRRDAFGGTNCSYDPRRGRDWLGASRCRRSRPGTDDGAGSPAGRARQPPVVLEADGDSYEELNLNSYRKGVFTMTYQSDSKVAL